jgi:vacuolar-type H+-ATPase subunit I/STV1
MVVSLLLLASVELGRVTDIATGLIFVLAGLCGFFYADRIARARAGIVTKFGLSSGEWTYRGTILIARVLAPVAIIYGILLMVR